MIAAFLTRFGLAMLFSSLLYAGIGYATQRLMFSPPAERYYLRGLSFEVPEGWGCHMESTEVVCRPPGDLAKHAIIIGTAKTAWRDDNLEAYRARLSKPHNFNPREETQMLSVSDVTYDGHVWVDGWQRNSEVRNYDTRYLATVFGASAVLVTFSCHRVSCTQFEGVSDRFAASVRGSGAR